MAEADRVVPKVQQRMEEQQLMEAESGSQTLRWSGTGKLKGFREHVAFDGSLQGASGRDAACGRAVEQLDYDKEEEPLYAVSGKMLAELEVQRTVNTAESRAFTKARAGLVWPSTIHTDRVGIIDVLQRGGEGCCGPKQIDADLWIN